MDITSQDIVNGKLIAVSGDIDLHTSPRLREQLLRFTKKRIPTIVIDLKAVSYMDSSGIATLVEALKEMKTYKGILKLCSLSERVSEIFTFAKLDKVFQIYKNQEDAISG